MDRFTDVVQDKNGRVISGASVLVLDEDGLPAEIYETREGTLQDNPFLTDALGKLTFCAADGLYSVHVSVNESLYAVLQDVRLDDPEEGAGSGDFGTVVTDTFSGTGAQTVFALAAAPKVKEDTQVYVGGVYQKKSTYTIIGAVLTFTVAPAAGASNIEVVTITPGTGDAVAIKATAPAGQSGTNVQAVLNSLGGTFSSTAAFLASGSGAGAVGLTPIGTIASTNMQDAVAELNADLLGHVAASDPHSQYAFRLAAAPGSGALPLTQAQVNNLVVHADKYSFLADAIAATPAGGTLILGIGPYNTPGLTTRDNIRIVGQAMPWVNVGKTALTGGTIIKGQWVIDGSNVTIENLGVDAGSAWCVASNGGVATNAFVAHNVAQTALNTNNHFRNVIGLCKDATSAFHSMLIESQQFGSADNLVGYYGTFGCVFKVADFEIGKASGYENATTSVYIKGDSYAPVQRVNATCLSAYNSVGTNSAQPVAIHASTGVVQDVNVGKINVYGGQRQVRLISNTSGVNIMDNVNVGLINARLGTAVGLDTYGIIYNANFAACNVVNACGYGVTTETNAHGVAFGQINYTDTASLNKADAINLGGDTSFDNIVATNGYDKTTPTGITIAAGAKCRVGDYVGRLNWNGGTLQNGWTAVGAAGAKIRCGRVKVYGRINNAANKGAGKDVVLAISSALTGGIDRYFTVNALNGGVLNQAEQVLIIVRSTGNIEFPFQNTGSFVPANISYIHLDTLAWDIDEITS